MPVDLTTAPPQSPPAAGTALPGTPLLTDRPDFIFVGYPWARAITRNDPMEPLKVYVADEVSVAVTAWLARQADVDGEPESKEHPHIWLAPELAQVFEDQAAPALMQSSFDWLTAEQLAARVDLTSYDKVLIENDTRRVSGGAGVDEAAERAAAEAVNAQGREHNLGLILYDAMASRAEWPQRQGTIKEIVEAHCRAEVRAALYDRKHWYVLLRPSAQEEARLKYEGQPWLKTSSGVALRQQVDWDRWESKELPVALAVLYSLMRKSHEEHSDGECHAFPSEQTVKQWMKERGTQDPTPPVTRSDDPDPRATEKVYEAVEELCERPRCHADGPDLEDVRKKVRRSRDKVKATLDRLVAARRLVTRTGERGRLGYRPQ